MNPGAAQPEIKSRAWRSLAERKDTPENRAWIEREFPEISLQPVNEIERRSFLKLLGATLAAAGLNGCTRQPIEQIVPYVRQPEEMVLGEPLYFATAMPLSGYGTGIVVKSREGRPIKADGNALHPSSGTGSNVWIQACLLDLYNPARAREVTRSGEPSSLAALETALHEWRANHNTGRGAGLRILTGTVTSPTLGRQMRTLLDRYPEARWHQWEPVNWDHAFEGSRIAFGEPLATHYRFSQAEVVVSFDSDFLATHPEHLRHAREFTAKRRVVAGQNAMNRLYVLESSPTITGSLADHRLPLSTSGIEQAAWFVAGELGIAVPPVNISDTYREWLTILARDMKNRPGKSVVCMGPAMPPSLHELEQRINERLRNFGATVFHTEPAPVAPVNHARSLSELAEAMEDGSVDWLLILGGNPAFDAPADFDFARRLKNVRHSVHLSLEANETSAACEWLLPQAHFLEAWSDIRAFDGTASIMQPLIAPLFGGHSDHEILNLFLQPQWERSGYETVRASWREQHLWAEFEPGWRRAVHDGLIAGTALPFKKPNLKANSADIQAPAPAKSGMELSFRPEPHLWDGRFASNPWLLEAPRPLTQLVWDNAALISPALAEREHLAKGDLVELTAADRTVRAPVFILPGQAAETITLHLGHGRQSPEPPEEDSSPTGFNFYPLRTSTSLWCVNGVSLRKTLGNYPLVTTQTHFQLPAEERQIFREGTLTEFLRDPEFLHSRTESPGLEETLYHPGDYDYPLKWGMAIDLTTCIGCNACILACNIENNIPIVGKKQVAISREMLWLRVDTYFSGDPSNPRFLHQPVPCMHCENAPCEYVCPVEATLHDHEGLNLQVYNRCIGTRYCSNNCPYKVRRFNFLRYADYDSELAALRNNPEVTVRWRGVMEKCTYCVQRISGARIRAKEEGRPIRDGEVKTACQEACPASAIVFGPMSDPKAEVSRRKAHPLDFSMLGQLNTRPRTTYGAKLRNPNPEIETA